MSEHVGPGHDSGPFKADEANIRAHVAELDRKRRDARYAEAAEPKAEKPKAKAKKK